MTITKLTTIVDIRDWLREQDRLSHSTTAYGIYGLEQFAIDWIEEEIDRAERYLESEQITVDDITFAGAVHYRADCREDSERHWDLPDDAEVIYLDDEESGDYDGLEMSDDSCGECGHPYKRGDETHYPECSRIKVS